MNKNLRVDVINTQKSKNSFGNSFNFDNDLSLNQFEGYNSNEVNNSLSSLRKKQQEEKSKIQQPKRRRQRIQNTTLYKQKAIQQKKKQEQRLKQVKEINKSKLINQNNNAINNNKKQARQPNEKIQIKNHVPQKQIKNIKNANLFKSFEPSQQESFSEQDGTSQYQESESKQSQVFNKNKSKFNTKIQVKPIQNVKKQEQSPLKPLPKVQYNFSQQKTQQVSNIKEKQRTFQQQKQQKQSASKNNKKLTQIINTPSPLKSPNKRQDKQSSKIYQIKQNITKLNTNLNTINNDYKQLQRIQAADQILFKKNINRVKQFQIREFLTNKRLEKQRRQQKIKQMRQKQHELISKTISMEEEQRKKLKQEKISQIKQKDYIQPKQKRQRYLSDLQQKNRMAQSVIQKYKNVQPYHVKIQKEFEKKQLKRKQKQEQLLMQRKQRFQSLDFQELQEHKRLYEQRLQELENMKKQQREQEQNKIVEDNHLMRDQIWKGPSHDIVDQERLEKKRKKKEPKEKVKKMKNYYQHIKKNFLPKTHQPKRSSPIHNQRISQTLGNYSGRYLSPDDEMLAHYDPNKKHIKKFKYFQGKAIGQVVQSVPVARSHSQQRKIGQGYLQYLKNLPKKRQNSQSTTQIDSQDLQMINKKFNQVTKVKRQSIPFYQNTNKKRTVQISQKPTKQEVKLVYQKLKNQDIKLRSKKQLIRALKNNSPKTYEYQKQMNADMVLNMQRKLDLLTKL